MRDLEKLKEVAVDHTDISDNCKSFVIKLDEDTLGIIVTKTMEDGWEFLSLRAIDEVSVINSLLRHGFSHPTIEDMNIVRNMFFSEDEPVLEYLTPSKQDDIFQGSIAGLFTNKNLISNPSHVTLKGKGKIISVPEQKSYDIRKSLEGDMERINIRLVNKKQHIQKRYPSYEDIINVQKQLYENEECNYFVFSELNDDFSVDLYKPVDEPLPMPPNVFGDLEDLMNNVNYEELSKTLCELEEEFREMIPEMLEFLEDTVNNMQISVDVQVRIRQRSNNTRRITREIKRIN